MNKKQSATTAAGKPIELPAIIPSATISEMVAGFTITSAIKFGSPVWCIDNNEVKCGNLLRFRTEAVLDYGRYTQRAEFLIEGIGWLPSTRCFATKQELIASL